MNMLKSLFIIAILGAIAYGAYVSITRKQQLDSSQADTSMFSGTSPADPQQLATAATPDFSGQQAVQGVGPHAGGLPNGGAGVPAAIGGSAPPAQFTPPQYTPPGGNVAVQGSTSPPAWPPQKGAFPQGASAGTFGRLPVNRCLPHVHLALLERAQQLLLRH